MTSFICLGLLLSFYIESNLSFECYVRSWSNRNGQVLTQINQDLWVAERPFVWNGIDVGGRSAICKLADNTLFVHSPINGTADLLQALQETGCRVSTIVAPNFEHLKYTPQWGEIFPEATVLGCTGLKSLKPDYPVDQELGAVTLSSLKSSFDSLLFDCEVNPFTGKPFFNEVVFYHKSSKSLLCTDVYWNYPSSSAPNYNMPGSVVPVPGGTRLWKLGMDKVYWPFYQRFMVGLGGERRDKYNQAVERLLSWEVETIVPCHGDLIYGKEVCKQVLYKHFVDKIAG